MWEPDFEMEEPIDNKKLYEALNSKRRQLTAGKVLQLTSAKGSEDCGRRPALATV